MLKRLIAVVALALASGAHAAPIEGGCESVTVNVSPFAYEVDRSLGWVALGEMSGMRVTFGSVRADLMVTQTGCAVDISYKFTMYIASELREGTCASDHVVAHEMRHLAVYQAAMAGMAWRVQEAARQVGVRAAVMAEADAIRELNEAIDSPEEYATNRTACSGQVFRLTVNRRF